MLSIGDIVTVRNSTKLHQKGLANLANKSGNITKILGSRDNIIGVYVDIRMGRRIRNYYIPFESIEAPGDINKIRTLSILKSTIL